ncbi:hypothetical protein [Photobacterium angustum]|uniref:Dnd system-associated protein 4 n=1 Tax=Photobacterium angustum TaxID=661 RepID=A0A855S5X3_PHOAN|nr:hypothetical protein [Photobacterium angustum]KJF81621.1 hypothetical protein UB36_11335 [Photobacterium damselae subsp. damselae]KJG40876.1 hypothetical protein UA35_11980 [Photobacterium angustum]KJG45267.1 hypothetical protein UA31_11340 [Photobacterium angustum]KJG48782.1 hypothetical protein UA30_11750 [Photobacterium angustum]KJG52500.1 hypothetical protein UA34_13370 [Photobacterium angustum]
MADVIDWRKLSVRRDARFELLEDKFCSTKGASALAVFSTVKELMVFAALVGVQLNKYEPIAAKVKTTPILLDTYSSTNHDSYIYLIALFKEPTLDILRNENLRSAIGIFEGYCNGGLKHIDDWIMNNIGEPIMTNILFNQTLEYLVSNE